MVVSFVLPERSFDKSLSQKVPLSLRERVGVRASERRNRWRKPAAIRATLTPDPSPAERVSEDYGVRSKWEPVKCELVPFGESC